MQSPAQLRARAARLNEQAAREDKEIAAGALRAMASAFERAAQQREMTLDGRAAISTEKV